MTAHRISIAAMLLVIAAVLWIKPGPRMAANADMPCLAPPPAAASEPSATADRPPARPSTRPLEEHWVQDWRIRALMQQIAIDRNPNWPKHLPQDPESPATQPIDKSFKDASTLADSLAAAASELPKFVVSRRMTDQDKMGFIKLAGNLRTDALQLKDQAEGRKLEQMQRTLDRINWTCFDCHSRYRDLTGVLDPGRAQMPRDEVFHWVRANTRTVVGGGG